MDWFNNWLTPDRAVGLEGSVVGAVIRLMIYGKLDWRIAVLVAACAVASSYYFAIPFAHIISKDPAMIGPSGFLIGLVALQALTGVINLFSKFSVKPWEFLQYLPFFKSGGSKADADNPDPK